MRPLDSAHDAPTACQDLYGAIDSVSRPVRQDLPFAVKTAC